MKKLLTILLTVLIGLSSLTLSAQTVTVGEGTATNSYIPVYGLWLDANQHNQIIYPESMLTGLVGQSVNMLMFYLSSAPSTSWSSTVTLSMGTTMNSSFPSSTHDQSPVSQVYSGNFSINGNILTFVLDSTYTYTGGNLLLDIATVGGNYSSASFLGMAQPSASIYQYNDNSGVQSFLPKTMFVYGSCLAPTALSVDSITENSAILTWQPGGTETAWEVFIGNGTEDLSTVTWTPVTTNSHLFDNLSANTPYTVYLRADCGTEYSYAVITSFRTDCGPTLVPYTEGFESFPSYSQPTCWQFLNAYPNYSYDYPTINDYQARTGSNAMYFYTDYYNNPTQVQYAILPLFAEHITNLQLSLYSKRDYDYSGTFYIGYITDPTDESTFVPMVTHTGTSMGDDLYHRDIVDFSNVPVDPDSIAYIALGYQCNSYYGWYVDDIEVSLIPDCSVPIGLTTSNVTTNSATLSWTAGTATTFNVYYKEHNDTAYTEELSITDSFLLIDNLIHSTEYEWYVVSICGDGSLQTSEVATFPTGCAAIDTLPYFIDFEVKNLATNLPYCWTRGNESSESPSIDSYGAYNGENVLYSYNLNTVSLPQIDDNVIDIHETRLSFYAQADDAGTHLQVGVMTNPNSTATFAPVGNTITLTNSYVHYEVSFSSYTGTGKYIAFRYIDDWESVYIDDVTLEFLPECSRPEAVWAQTIDSSSVTVAWSTANGQSSWEVVIGPHGFNPDTATTAVTASTPSQSFDNLAPNTTYDVFVRTDCGDEFSPWSNVMTFLTLTLPPATVPYLCNFEDPAENALWSFAQTGQANQWYIDTAVVTMDSSVHSMYISADSGATNTYDYTISTASWAYRDIQFSDANEFELSFDWICYGESSYDYMKVFIGNPTPVTEGVYTEPSGSIELAQLNQVSTWQHETISLGSAYKNSTKRLFFMWKNDMSMGTNPPAAVDNINIIGVACAQPVNVMLANASSTSATIIFTPGGEGDNAWELMYGTSDSTMTTVELTTPSYLLDNLMPGTNYYVYARTLCSDGDTSAWSSVYSFQTECVTIDSVPRFWDFESNNIGGTTSAPMPACWFRGLASSYYPYIYDYDYYAYAGTSYLSFYNSESNLAIMPAIDTTVLPVNTLQVSFYAKASSISSSDALLIVGVVSDVYNMGSFVPVDTIALTEDYPTYPYVVMLNHYTGNGDRIAFKNYSTTTYAYNYVYMDNLTLEEVPNCLPVSNLAAVSSDMTSITLNWTEGSEESSWNVEYKEVSDTVWSNTVATSIPFTLDNLTTATLYDVRVQADCGSDLAPWIYTQAHTQVCDTANQCEYTFLLTDSFGDGWNGGYVTVMQNGIPVAQLSATNHNLSSTQTTDTAYVGLCDGFSTSLLWHDSQYNGEVTITIIDPFGTTLHSINTPYQGTIYTFDANCLVPTCPAPTYIAVSNVDMNNATVTWTPGGDEANWNVEYKEASAATWTVVPVTSTSYTITGLTAATLYDVRVQAECDPTNSNPSTYVSTTFSTGICAAADQCTYTFNLADSYGDGWNDGFITVQQNGITVATVEMTSGSTATETINLCDNISTSLIWNTGMYDSEVSFSVNGPDGTVVYTASSVSSGTLTTFTTDCGGSGPVITDPTVTTDAATSIAQTTATLNATITNPDNVTITAKGFEWKATTGGTYTQVAGTGTGNTFSYNLSGLTPNTGYTYKAFITFNGTTVYGSEMTFTTLEQGAEPCDVPTGLDTTNVANETISITWNANSGVNSWNIQYRPQNGTWTSANSTTNNYTITGLTGSTTYEIQVQAVCANGQTSDWSASLVVTTKNVGIDSWLDGSVTLYPNPAKEYVDIRVDGDLNVTAMEVYDVYGKLVNTVNVVDNPTRINVSGLANGMYFVRVTTEKGAVTKTFVKK
jgi:hypothetical protein